MTTEALRSTLTLQKIGEPMLNGYVNGHTNGHKEVLAPKFSLYFPTGEDLGHAETVAAWTKNEDSMLTKSPHEVIEMFKTGRSVLIMDGDTVVSHAGATFEYKEKNPNGTEKKTFEIGAVVTSADDSYRHKGAATAAVKAIIARLRVEQPDAELFAFANDASLGLFLKLGGEVMAYEDVPADAYKECAGCKCPIPKKERVLFCVDTPVRLTGVFSKAA